VVERRGRAPSLRNPRSVVRHQRRAVKLLQNRVRDIRPVAKETARSRVLNLRDPRVRAVVSISLFLADDHCVHSGPVRGYLHDSLQLAQCRVHDQRLHA
jgi:hypothetical protein